MVCLSLYHSMRWVGEESCCHSVSLSVWLYDTNKNHNLAGYGILDNMLSHNALQSLWMHRVCSRWLAPHDKQTIFHCLKLLFSRGLIQTPNAPRERKEIKLNPSNRFPGTDSFIFERLAVSHANKTQTKYWTRVSSGSRVHNWMTEAVKTPQLHHGQSEIVKENGDEATFCFYTYTFFKLWSC